MRSSSWSSTRTAPSSGEKHDGSVSPRASGRGATGSRCYVGQVEVPERARLARGTCALLCAMPARIYQLFVRLFSNTNLTNAYDGTLETNGVGRFVDITEGALSELASSGITHVWLTGVVRHATLSDFSRFDPALAADLADIGEGARRLPLRDQGLPRPRPRSRHFARAPSARVPRAGGALSRVRPAGPHRLHPEPTSPAPTRAASSQPPASAHTTTSPASSRPQTTSSTWSTLRTRRSASRTRPAHRRARGSRARFARRMAVQGASPK